MFGPREAIVTDLSLPLTVGSVSFAPRLLLAPMSGVTNSAFRKLIRRENPGAVGLVVTEFISIEGLTRSNKQSLRMMHFDPEERPLAIQIFGYDADRMAEAAKMAEDAGADIVDINSGCPVPKVVRRGGGCELMRRPDHMAKMLTAVRQAISVPLTLKIRSGWDEDSRNGIEIAHIAEACGVQLLTVHGRTRVQLYRGLADWDFVAEVARAVSIPVIGSGDVVDAESARARLASGVAGLMIGRGALSNPWVFSEIHSELSGNTPQAFMPIEHKALRIMRVLRDYHDLLMEDMPEKGAIGKMKQLASQTIRAVPGAASVRRTLCRSNTLAAFLALMDQYSNYLEGGVCPDFLELGASDLEGVRSDDPSTDTSQTVSC